MPTYNERGGIAELVAAVCGVFRESGVHGELVIVDDNSPDGTGRIADELATRYPVTVLHRAGKLGLGSAVMEGFGVARAPVVGVMDADFSHPPAVVLSADGTARLLDDETPELLLGVAPETKRREHVAVLEPGSTVLLYTDGLVERRDRDLDTGAAELCAVLEACAGLPLDRLCDEVLERLFLPDAQDDVAMLALRLHPQDQPRPAEAGPQELPPNIEPAPDVMPEAGSEA